MIMKPIKLVNSPITYFVSRVEQAEWILFIHAAFVNHTMFREQFEYFQNNHNILAIDIIGHGQSTDTKKGDTIDKMSEWIFDILKVENIEKMHIILDKVNKIIDDNKDKLKNPTCSTCVHLHDNDWAKRYGKVCCSIWQVCDHYVNPNSKYNRKQKTYVRRPSNKACPNYEYGDDNFENRRRCIKEKNTR